MRYLITGGAGFIGSHLAAALIQRGDHVVALDDLSTGSTDNIASLADSAQFRFEHGSILEGSLVSSLVANCDAVAHLAASVGVQLIVQRPLESLVNNLKGTEVVMEP